MSRRKVELSKSVAVSAAGWRWDAVALALSLGLVGAAVVPATVRADTVATSLAGAWRGGGTVAFSSGAREQARCHVSLNPQGANSLSLSATCATQDGKARQFASLDRVGPNRFSGDFRNPDFGVSGRITLTVNGKSLTASLTSDRGSAVLNLSR